MNDLHSSQPYKIFWRNQFVGHVSEVEQDMGYIEGAWQPASTTAEFQDAFAHLVGKTFWGLSAEQMVWVQIPDLNMNCVVVHAPVDGRITFRLITSAEPPVE